MPTPIGNLADLSLRAVHVLGLVDAIACEDTRVTAGLLRHLGLDKPLLAVHEHNEAQAAQGLVKRLEAGERIALVSDAGTPAISDPGARVAAAVREAGLRIMPLPGASAVVTAISAAGDAAAQGFRFAGFLPASGRHRDEAVDALVADPACVACYEAPHRIAALLAALAAKAPERTVTVARELSKQFETLHTATAATLPDWLAADPMRLRGEFVVVLHARAAEAADPLAAGEPLLRALLPLMPLRQAVDLVAAHVGGPRKAWYERALALRDAQAGQEAAPTSDPGAEDAESAQDSPGA